MSMGDASPSFRLADFRPTRIHLVLLSVIALVFVPMLVLPQHWYSVAIGTIIVLLVTQWLGGPRHIYTQWRDRNGYGYYWMLRQAGTDDFRAEIVNAKNVNQVRYLGWTLWLRIGGWATRSFLRRPDFRESTFYRFTPRWSSVVDGVEEIIVTDNAGNRVTMTPNEFLARVTACGAHDTCLHNALAFLLRVRELSLKNENQRLVRKAEILERAVRSELGFLKGTILTINTGDRYKNSKEAKAVLARLENIGTNLERAMDIASTA